jgi:hypothetical protein
MTALGTVVILTALCGVIVVAGGIYLLAKGAIKLESTNPADALSIEWQKQFKMNTQVPGIAFFVIGLCFVVAALYAATPSRGTPIDLQGEVPGVDTKVNIVIHHEPWTTEADGDGQVKFRINPVRFIRVVAYASGYQENSKLVTLSGQPSFNFGPIQMKKISEEIKPKLDSIIPLPFLPPPINTRSFGVPK